MYIADFLSRLRKVRQHGEGSWMGCCPAHADRTPSLSVSEGDDGRILLKCFAGCSTEQVVGAMGLQMADLMGGERERERTERTKRREQGKLSAQESRKKNGKSIYLGNLRNGDVWKLHREQYRFVEWYDYRSKEGAIRYRKLRFQQVDPPHKKMFLQLVPDPESGAEMWRFGRSSLGVAEVLYNLPAVVEQVQAGGAVLIVEGEKDVATATALGLVATCNSDGAGKWRRGLAVSLEGCSRAWVIADKDLDEAEAKARNKRAKSWLQGQLHACDVVEDLKAHGIECKALCLPDLDGWPVKDLSDWVESWREAGGGGDLAGRLKVLLEAAPAWDVGLWRSRGSGAQQAQHGVTTSLSKKSAQPENVAVPEGEAPDSVAWLRCQLIQVMIDKDISSHQKKRAMAEVVCDWLGVRGKYFFDLRDRGHDTAMWFDAAEKRLHRVSQDYFRSWLSRATGFSREFRDYKMFLSAVEDEALVGERTRGITPWRYWHREGEVIYLSNGEGCMARIDRDGVGLVDNGTDGIVFEQRFTLEEWELVPEEEARDPFEECAVFKDISTIDGRGPMLVRLWLSGMFGSVGWKPLLVLAGAVGSGKTRVATAFFELLGMPARVTAIDALGNIKDFWSSVDKGGLFCLDNADHHVGWLPDALSVISTGGTFEKKKLYTDTETVTQEARCWAVVTSANPSFAADAGLSDRLITVLLERMERETSGSELSEEIRAARSPGLSWLCYTMRRALGWQEPVPKRMNRRHPDWAVWAWQIGAAAGYPEEAERALRENEAYKSLFSLQNDVFGRFLLSGMTDAWKGSAAELSEYLAEKCEGYSSEVWTVTKIGKALARLGIALKEVFNFQKLNHCGRAVYSFGPPREVMDEEDRQVDSPTLPMLGNVGDVGVESVKSHESIETRELLHFNPNIPNIPNIKENWEEENSDNDYEEPMPF